MKNIKSNTTNLIKGIKESINNGNLSKFMKYTTYFFQTFVYITLIYNSTMIIAISFIPNLFIDLVIGMQITVDSPFLDVLGFVAFPMFIIVVVVLVIMLIAYKYLWKFLTYLFDKIR